MASRNHLLALASAALLAAAGCNPVDMATRGFKEVKGSGAEVRLIRDLPAVELAEHGSIQVSQVISTIGDLVPREFVMQVDSELRTQMAGLRGFPGRGEPLLVQGEITYYQSQGTASVLLGRQKIAVMHVTAAAPSGARAADFLAIATSDALRTDDAELADSLARGVVGYFKQKLPKTPGGT